MIAKMNISLGNYSNTPNDEQWSAIQLLFPEHRDKEKPNYWYDSSITADIDTVMAVIAGKNFKVMVEAFSPHQALCKIKDKYDREIEEIENYAKGQIIQIHIPDMALLTYNEITNLDDCCTDEIQRMLNDRWRIIAVCPPNAQRRPDYILGRYTKESER
jgi:hypothetical protein